MNTLEISTKKYGVVELRENELALVTNAHLKMLGMTRLELHQCFLMGVTLMKKRNVKPRDKVRPCAWETVDGKWMVGLGRHSPITDPLRNGRRKEGVTH